jgi:hypothetical protein
VSPRRPAFNPFYPLLVLAGVAFVVTACAYGVMALKAMSPNQTDGTHPLLTFLEQHGTLLLVVELAVLAAATFLAMGTDSYWTSRGTERTSDGEAPSARPLGKTEEPGAGP